jgi:hypothetical protein
MRTPRLTPDQIASQHERYGPRTIALSAQQRVAVGGFFSPQILDGTRLLVLEGERVANPEFYPMLRSMGFNNLPDQSTATTLLIKNNPSL